MKAKTIAMILAMTMILVSLISGTLAWLTDKSDEVQNTFTTTDIDVTLIETLKPDGTEVAAGVTDWSVDLIPGCSYSKNPKVSVSEDSIDCYLFVKFEEPTNTTNILEYTSNLTTTNGWTQGDGTNIPNNVWYRTVTKTDNPKAADRTWELLKDNTVKISKDLTKTNMPSENLNLKYTAYAFQLKKNNTDNFTAAEAWKEINK